MRDKYSDSIKQTKSSFNSHTRTEPLDDAEKRILTPGTNAIDFTLKYNRRVHVEL